MNKALLVDELNPATDLSNDCPTFGLIEYIILEKRGKYCRYTVKLGIRNFLAIAKLFTNANLFTIYQVNWQIGHRKWFTIANLFLI